VQHHHLAAQVLELERLGVEPLLDAGDFGGFNLHGCRLLGARGSGWKQSGNAYPGRQAEIVSHAIISLEPKTRMGQAPRPSQSIFVSGS